jgi:hypothetical protein
MKIVPHLTAAIVRAGLLVYTGVINITPAVKTGVEKTDNYCLQVKKNFLSLFFGELFCLLVQSNRNIIKGMNVDSLENGLCFSADRTTVISFTPSADSESVEIPDSVISLPEGLFAGSSSLKAVKLPRFLRVLPDRLFADCPLLQKIVMPAEVDSLGFGTFSGCTSLKSIPFRAGLVELPSEVFSCCTSITSLVIPDTVRVIRRGAVSGCALLETVVLPSSLEKLEKEAFTGCTSLRHIRISEDNSRYRVDSDNGCLYEKQDDGVELIVLCPVDYERFAAKMIKDDFAFKIDEGSEEGTEGDENPAEHKGNAAMENEFMQNVQKDSSDEIAKKAAEIMASETIPEDDTVELVSEEEMRMLSAESDILSQNTFVDGNPVFITQDEIDKAVKSGDVMRTFDDSYFGPPVKRPEFPEEDKPASQEQKTAEDLMIERIASAAEKYECIELKKDVNKTVWNDSLYIFAENLVFDEDGDGHFSDALISCCRRIARSHAYTRIRFYYGIPLENEEFAQLFSEFIAERSTLYACSAENTAKLSECARRFCDMSGISLEKSMLELENKLAGIEDANILKMIVQDDYSA